MNSNNNIKLYSERVVLTQNGQPFQLPPKSDFINRTLQHASHLGKERIIDGNMSISAYTMDGPLELQLKVKHLGADNWRVEKINFVAAPIVIKYLQLRSVPSRVEIISSTRLKPNFPVIDEELGSLWGGIYNNVKRQVTELIKKELSGSATGHALYFDQFLKADVEFNFEWRSTASRVEVLLSNFIWMPRISNVITLPFATLKFTQHVLDGVMGKRVISGENHFISFMDLLHLLQSKKNYFDEDLANRIRKGDSTIHFNVDGKVLRLVTAMGENENGKPVFLIYSLYWPTRGAFKEMSDVAFNTWLNQLPKV